MNRIGLLSVAVIWIAALGQFSSAVSREASNPNVVILVADDLGWADVGYHGAPFPTPNLDRLAVSGVELDQFYVAPMCTPTRAALLTGRYWSRFGNTKPSNTQVLPFETVTLANAFRRLGYRTGIAGKWHLGSQPEWGPNHFGFDESYGSLAGGVGPWNHRYKKGDYSRTWHRNGEWVDEEGHVTDLILRECLRFIGQADARPFFLYAPFTAVHSPLDEPGHWMERVPAEIPPDRRQYAASVMHMDDAFGQIVAAAERRDPGGNTLFIFFSDNGGTVHPSDKDNGRYPGSYPKNQRLGLNAPLRGRKTELHEGGIRVPALVYWPNRLEPKRISTPIHVADWMPTLCHLAGFTADVDLAWDGVNVWPLLSGGSERAEQRQLYWRGVSSRSFALRSGDFKLLVFPGRGSESSDLRETRELFDLSTDPYEQTNLAGVPEFRDIGDRLRRLLKFEKEKDGSAPPSHTR